MCLVYVDTFYLSYWAQFDFFLYVCQYQNVRSFLSEGVTMATRPVPERKHANNPRVIAARELFEQTSSHRSRVIRAEELAKAKIDKANLDYLVGELIRLEELFVELLHDKANAVGARHEHPDGSICYKEFMNG